MREKIDKYNAIMRDLYELLPHLPFAFKNEEEARTNAANAIRELRQIIERLRRLVDDGEPNEDTEDARIYRMVDVWKLPKDVLAKVVWEFLQWCRSEDGDCPAKICEDYPCQFKKEEKKTLDENLADGQLDQETYDKYLNDMDFDDCGNGEGCWASYYVWCYLNGYKPLSGEKETK